MFEAKGLPARQFFDNSPAHSDSMGQEAAEKWTAGRLLQPE
jgi:hypothetical protein